MHIMKQVMSHAGVGLALLGSNAAMADDLSQQTPIEMSIALGNAQNGLMFSPARMTFDAGKLYKLVLKNPSKSKHYFSAIRFASAVWTRKVETGKEEVKGNVSEIELKPGGKAEWFFVPVQAGTYKLKCTIKGHAAGGMVGELTIK